MHVRLAPQLPVCMENVSYHADVDCVASNPCPRSEERRGVWASQGPGRRFLVHPSNSPCGPTSGVSVPSVRADTERYVLLQGECEPQSGRQSLHASDGGPVKLDCCRLLHSSAHGDILQSDGDRKSGSENAGSSAATRTLRWVRNSTRESLVHRVRARPGLLRESVHAGVTAHCVLRLAPRSSR